MGAEATNQPNGAAAAPPQAAQPNANAQPGGEAPGPVPYAVFAEAQHKLRAVEAERDAVKAQLGGGGGPRVQELETKLASAREEMGLRVSLARAGVHSDPGLDYLVSRYTSIEPARRPKADDFIGQLKSAEPAFFGVPAAAPVTTPVPATQASASAQPTAGAAPGGSTTSTAIPTRTSPDATARATVVTGQDPPLSEDLIKSMDQETFNRRWSEIDSFMKTKRKGR
jgi:hypothetical protein